MSDPSGRVRSGRSGKFRLELFKSGHMRSGMSVRSAQFRSCWQGQVKSGLRVSSSQVKSAQLRSVSYGQVRSGRNNYVNFGSDQVRLV